MLPVDETWLQSIRDYELGGADMIWLVADMVWNLACGYQV